MENSEKMAEAIEQMTIPELRALIARAWIRMLELRDYRYHHREKKTEE